MGLLPVRTVTDQNYTRISSSRTMYWHASRHIGARQRQDGATIPGNGIDGDVFFHRRRAEGDIGHLNSLSKG